MQLTVVTEMKARGGTYIVCLCPGDEHHVTLQFLMIHVSPLMQSEARNFVSPSAKEHVFKAKNINVKVEDQSEYLIYVNFGFSQLDVLTQVTVMSNTPTPHKLEMLLNGMEIMHWGPEKWPEFKKKYL